MPYPNPPSTEKTSRIGFRTRFTGQGKNQSSGSRTFGSVPLSIATFSGASLEDRLIMMHRGQIIHDFQGAEKRRLRPDDLLARFEDVRRAEQLDESAISAGNGSCSLTMR